MCLLFGVYVSFVAICDRVDMIATVENDRRKKMVDVVMSFVTHLIITHMRMPQMFQCIVVENLDAN